MSLPVPYYDQDGITIYNADCRQVLPFLERFDLLLTDPPYGIGLDTRNRKYATNGTEYRNVHGDDVAFDPAVLLDERWMRAVIWGGNCFASRLPDHPGWLSWVKIDQNNTAIRQAETEFAWTNFVARSQAFRYTWIGAGKEEKEFNGRPMLHPCQKPVALMKWCIGLVPYAKSVLDPFMGSGTTLVAAKLLGLRAVGIEISEEYCRKAVQRLRQQVLAFSDVE